MNPSPTPPHTPLDEPEEVAPISLPPELIERLKESAVRAVIWGFVGTLYGMLFIVSVALFRLHLPLIDPLIPSGILAAGLGALIYGSMRLAVIIAAICAMASVILFINDGNAVHPLEITIKSGVLGGLIGAIYGLFARRSRVGRAHAKVLAGLFSGLLVASMLYLGEAVMRFPLEPAWQVAILCPLTGFVYTRVVEGFIRWAAHWLPTSGDGALVGMGVAAFIGFGLWLVAGYVTPDVVGAYAGTAAVILDGVPDAVVAGLLGGVLGGFLGGLAGLGWQDL